MLLGLSVQFRSGGPLSSARRYASSADWFSRTSLFLLAVGRGSFDKCLSPANCWETIGFSSSVSKLLSG